MAALDTGI